MELRRFIFNVRYKPKFGWFDRRGAIFELLKNTGMFNGFGWSKESAVTAEQDEGDIWRNIALSPLKIAGAIEGLNLNINDILEFLRVFRRVSEIMNLTRAEILRIGTRFLYTKKMSFDTVNAFLVNAISPDVKNVLGGDVSDCAVIPVIKYGDHTCQYNLGPIRRQEYERFFKRPDKIDYDECGLFDVDYYSLKFQSLSFEAFAQEAHGKIQKPLQALAQQLETYAKQQG